MNNSAVSGANISITKPVLLHVVDAQTSAENGRKFTKYKVSVNYNGQEWDIWRRYKEFHTLNERVRRDNTCSDYIEFCLQLRRIRSDLKLPGRRLLGDSFEPDFVLKRQRGLNDYVQQIATNSQIVNL